MSYEMKPGETLAELIDYAGGFSGDALHRTGKTISPDRTRETNSTI